MAEFLEESYSFFLESVEYYLENLEISKKKNPLRFRQEI